MAASFLAPGTSDTGRAGAGPYHGVVTHISKPRGSERNPVDREELPTIFNLAASDPRSELIDRSQLSDEALRQIDRIMAEMGRLRAVERKISRASQRYMNLNETDMRAIRFLISAKNTGTSATPGMLAKHLGITTASVTKMVDRLEKAGHVVRTAHPTDRRSRCIAVTAETHLAARQQVGRHHAARFGAAERLSPAERESVIRFLAETAKDLEDSFGSVGERKPAAH